MKYHGKLYGKLWDKHFDTGKTTDDWDAMEKRIAELEAENEVLRNPPVDKSNLRGCPNCGSTSIYMIDDPTFSDDFLDKCEDCGHEFV